MVRLVKRRLLKYLNNKRNITNMLKDIYKRLGLETSLKENKTNLLTECL